MPNIEDFLTKTDEEEIVETIRLAETKTSGEIRVHIEQSCNIDIYERALDVFYILKMDNTKAQNGVLIYVSVDNKAFVILGDQGINNKVGSSFWDSTRDHIQQQFKSGNFKQGLINGITEAGDVLKTYFPWQLGDKDEIENTISKG